MITLRGFWFDEFVCLLDCLLILKGGIVFGGLRGLLFVFGFVGVIGCLRLWCLFVVSCFARLVLVV